MIQIYIHIEVLRQCKTIAKGEINRRLIHVFIQRIIFCFKMLTAKVQLIRRLIPPKFGRSGERSIKILMAIEIGITTYSNILSVVKCSCPEHLILGIFISNLGIQPRITTRKAYALHSFRTQIRVSSFIKITVIILHFITKRVITWASYLTNITALNSPFAFLPGQR